MGISISLLSCFEFNVSMHVSKLLYSNKEERKKQAPLPLPNQTLQTPSILVSYPVMLTKVHMFQHKKRKEKKKNNPSSHPRIIQTCKKWSATFASKQPNRKKKKNLRLQLTFNQAQVSTLNRYDGRCCWTPPLFVGNIFSSVVHIRHDQLSIISIR